MIKSWLDKNLKGDPIIWGIIFTFSILSVLVVYSATGSLAYKKMQGNTEHYLVKHSMLLMLSLGCMWIAHRVNYKFYSKLSRLALWITVPLLIVTYFIGTNINDANRWITIPLINQS